MPTSHPHQLLMFPPAQPMCETQVFGTFLQIQAECLFVLIKLIKPLGSNISSAPSSLPTLVSRG